MQAKRKKEEAEKKKTDDLEEPRPLVAHSGVWVPHRQSFFVIKEWKSALCCRFAREPCFARGGSRGAYACARIEHDGGAGRGGAQAQSEEGPMSASLCRSIQDATYNTMQHT